MPIERVKKRDGRIVEFDRSRIEKAIEKACQATESNVSTEVISGVTDKVIAVLEEKFLEKIPGVEDVQDEVERKIAEQGLFEVARAYILYREEHAELRKQAKEELLEKIEKHAIKVIKRDGARADFDIEEVRDVLGRICGPEAEKIDFEAVLQDVKQSMYDGVSTKEINKAAAMALSARIEQDSIYSELAARVLFNELYKEILGAYSYEEGFEAAYQGGFEKQIKFGLNCGRLDTRLLEFDLSKIGKIIDVSRDRIFQYLGAQTLYSWYFLRDENQNVFELPQYFWLRIAMALAVDEKDREERTAEFYNAMSRLLYIPSSPTLFHAGTPHPQMSSCYLTTVEDDLHHIFKRIDSTDIPVCLNLKARHHKTMREFAKWGKTGKGWFYGLKMHLVTDLEETPLLFLSLRETPMTEPLS